MNTSGFTLIEVLVVVIIISILTAVAVPQYRRSMDRAKAAEAAQMLPALFDARERWVTEHQYVWDGGAIYQGDKEVKPVLKQLDIQLKGHRTSFAGDNNAIQTKNFIYQLVGPHPADTDQACVVAFPDWGENRGLTGAKIYYRGDKFSCTDTTQGAACDILSVADDNHRSGCI